MTEQNPQLYNMLSQATNQITQGNYATAMTLIDQATGDLSALALLAIAQEIQQLTAYLHLKQ